MREDDRHYVSSIHLERDILTYAAILLVTLDTFRILHRNTAGTLNQHDCERKHEEQDHYLQYEDHQSTGTGIVEARGELLNKSPREARDDTDQDDEGNTVSYTAIGDTLTKPHDEHRTCTEQDGGRDCKPVESNGERLTCLTHLYCQVNEITRSLEEQDSHGQIARDLVHLLTAGLTLFLHLLEIRHCDRKQLYHNRCGDVRHDTQRKDRRVREGSTGEHIEQRHQTTCCLTMQSRECRGINTGKNDERTETIDEHEQKRGQQTAAEVLDLPDIFNCLNKTHNSFRLTFNELTISVLRSSR